MSKEFSRIIRADAIGSLTLASTMIQVMRLNETEHIRGDMYHSEMEEDRYYSKKRDTIRKVLCTAK